MRDILVTDYLNSIASEYPEKEAFVDSVRSITFSSLRVEALHIAEAIIQEGLFKSPVVIYLDKSVECIAAFMGTAYSGNFYTPIDTQMPNERVSKIFETLSPKLIITDDQHKDNIEHLSNGIKVIIYQEAQDQAINENDILKITSKVIDTDLLYILFTSGSTGTPKGVSISHRAVIDYIDWFTDEFHISKDDCFGNQAPLHFDLSIQDVYAPLKTGCTVHLMDRKLFSFPATLMKYLAENGINIIMWVPSALCAVADLRGLRLKTLPRIRMVLFCGEVMPNKQLNMWRDAYPETTFVNLYGPSETCDASTYYVVDRPFADDDSLPIGFPCRNTGIILLNEDGRQVQDGEAGEICIRGSSLSNGYYNDKEKTKNAFVQNPLNTAYPELIYKTGDLAKYNEFGELIYQGRKDFQIKHSGHRIELGEIEVAATAVQQVDRIACIYDDKKDHIILFYTGKAEKEALKNALRAQLPAYMLPQKLERLVSMPLNANGKIDRTFLKAHAEEM